MASTASTMQALGSEAPAFTLPNTHAASGGPTVSLADYVNHKALLIAFICNHCPYVIHIRDAFNAFAKEYAPLGLATVAISANDASTHPDDAPEMMSKEAERYGFAFLRPIFSFSMQTANSRIGDSLMLPGQKTANRSAASI